MDVKNLKVGDFITHEHFSTAMEIKIIGSYKELLKAGYDMPEPESCGGINDAFVGVNTPIGTLGLNVNWVKRF